MKSVVGGVRLAFLLVSPTFAQSSSSPWNDLPDRFQIDTGYFRLSANTLLRYNGPEGASGEVDCEDDLGLVQQVITFWVEGSWRVGRRHQLKLAFTRVSRDKAVYTLGRFEVLVDGKPLRTGRKHSKHTLALLKALIALGGRRVSRTALVDALWPDIDGDLGQNALEVTLHRLRCRLGVPGAIAARNGCLDLDPALVWVDALAPGSQKVIWLLIHKRAQESGNMMHLVTKELDKGPPISYCTFPIRGAEFDPLWAAMEKKLRAKMLAEIMKKEGEQNPLFAKIRQEGAKREIPLVVQTVKAFAKGRIRLENKKIIAEGKALDKPYCLNKEIEEAISKT